MREVRVQNLQGVERFDEGIRLSVTTEEDELSIVIPPKIWDELTGTPDSPDDPESSEPTSEEMDMVREIESGLSSLASYDEFGESGTYIEDVSSGAGSSTYRFILRSTDLYSVSTGYVFVPVVTKKLVSDMRVAVSGDEFVEQAYVIGSVAAEEALSAGDDDVRVLSVRGRRSSTSRFEMAPELWRVLSENLRWRDVETTLKTTRAKDRLCRS